MDTLPIILSAITAFAATISAGILIKKLQNKIGVVCAFAAGFFIALAVFDLLPDVLVLAPPAQISLVKLLLTGTVGFAALFASDRGFSRFHSSNRKLTKRTRYPRVGLLSTAEFCSHGFLEGIAIGVSFQLQFALGIFVAVAVVAHDFCDGVSTLALMLNSGNTPKSSIAMLFVDALAPVLGVATTLFVVLPNYVLVYALSFLVGSFLYMGGGSLLPDAYHMNRPKITAIFFATGFLLIVLFRLIFI
jgi:zinc transporter ZupT